MIKCHPHHLNAFLFHYLHFTLVFSGISIYLVEHGNLPHFLCLAFLSPESRAIYVFIHSSPKVTRCSLHLLKQLYEAL